MRRSCSTALPGCSLALALSLALAACGGGGGDAGSPPPAGQTDAQADAAARAGARALYDASAHRVTLSWTDTLDGESGYRIEKLTAGGWTALQSLAAVAGSGSATTWSSTLDQDMSLRVVASLSGRDLVMGTASHGQQLDVAMPPAGLSLVAGTLDDTGAIPLSLQGAPASGRVDFAVDGAALGAEQTQSPYAQRWDLAGVLPGHHLVTASLRVSDDVTLQLGTAVPVSRTATATAGAQQLQVVTSVDSRDLLVSATVTPANEVASVQASVDGHSLGVQATPTCRQNFGCSYDFSMPLSQATNGQHTVQVKALDAGGHAVQASQSVLIDPPPTIAMSSPASGTVTTAAQIHLSGTVSDDAGESDLSVLADGKPLLHLAVDGPFDVVLPIDSLGAGSHAFQVQARDRQGVTSSFDALVFVEGGGASPQAVSAAGRFLTDLEGDAALVQSVDPSVTPALAVLHGAGAGQSVTALPTAGMTPFGLEWNLSGGRVVGSLLAADGSSHVTLWEADGTRRDLSAEAGETEPSQGAPVLQGDWAAWPVQGASPHLVLYDVATRRLVRVAPPAGAKTVSSAQPGVVSRGSEATLYFGAGDVNGAPAGVYSFDTAAGVSVRLSPAGVADSSVQTDGRALAWARLGPDGNGFELVGALLAQPGVSQVVASNVSQFLLRDGVLAWVENTGSTSRVRASAGNTPQVLADSADAQLLADAGGVVAFSTNGTTHVWTPAGGDRRLLGFAAATARVDGSWLYFSATPAGPLYRVPL